MAKYKNSVADIELLPNVKKWNSVLVLEDDQEVSCVFLLLHIHICFEVLIDTKMSAVMKQSRPDNIKISRPSLEEEDAPQRLGCQVTFQPNCSPRCIN